MTSSPTGPVVAPAIRLPPPGSKVEFSRPSIEPGGRLVVTGTGCDPGAALTVSIRGETVATSTAGADGAFSVPVRVPDIAVGRYDLVITCGPTFTLPLDIVVSTRPNPPGSTLAVIVFFLLLPVLLFRRRRSVPGPPR